MAAAMNSPPPHNTSMNFFHRSDRILGTGIRFVSIAVVVGVGRGGIDHDRTVSRDNAGLTRDILAVGWPRPCRPRRPRWKQRHRQRRPDSLAFTPKTASSVGDEITWVAATPASVITRPSRVS